MSKNNKNISSFFSKDFLIFLGVFTGIITLTVFVKILQSDFKFFFSFSFLPLIAGLLYEQRKLHYSWKEISIKGFVSFSILNIIFLIGTQGKRGEISQGETSIYLSLFCFSYLIISIAYSYYLQFEKKLIANITEGTLLLQSLSFFYLLFDNGFFNTLTIYKIVIYSLLLIIGIYVFLQIISKKPHSDLSKLILSVWSSLITLTFSIFLFEKLIVLDFSENYSIKDNLLIILNFFLFGVSLIYSLENIWLLIRFIKGKYENWNQYKERIKALKQEHVDRFINYQLDTSTTIFTIFILAGTYYLNYSFNWFNSTTMIWLVFLVFPYIGSIWGKYMVKHN